MISIQKIQAAAKAAPHYRVTYGALEVIGAPGSVGTARWTFDYIVRRPVDGGKVRTFFGKRNAEEYLRSLTADLKIEEVVLSKPDPKTLPAQASTSAEMPKTNALILPKHKAHAVYKAMCELNDIGAIIQARVSLGSMSYALVHEEVMSDDICVTLVRSDLGYVERTEHYSSQNSFKTAYGIED